MSKTIKVLILIIVMAISLLLILISISICKKDQSDMVFEATRSDPQNRYEPLSLLINGEPMLVLGEKVDDVRHLITFTQDPNGKNYDRGELLDYYSSDNALILKTNRGSINGILFFTADRPNNEISQLSGSWLLDIDLQDEAARLEAVKLISEKLFPILTDKLELRSDWQFTNEKQTLTETFSIEQTGNSPHRMTLKYSARLKP